MTPEELKVRLLAEAEVIIYEIVGQDMTTQPRSLNEIEQGAMKAGQQVKVAVLAGLVANTPPTSGRDTCPQGGGRLKIKVKRSKWVLTQVRP